MTSDYEPKGTISKIGNVDVYLIGEREHDDQQRSVFGCVPFIRFIVIEAQHMRFRLDRVKMLDQRITLIMIYRDPRPRWKS